MLSNENRLSKSFTTFLVVFALVIMMVGCPANDSVESAKAAKTPKKKSAVRLTILVQDDEDLARSIQRLRGEWQEHSGGDLSVVPYPLAGGKSLPDHLNVDLVVFSSRFLGELCEDNAIREVRSSVLRNEELIFEDFFPLLRTREMSYGKKLMALPVGCPVPLMALAEGTSVSECRLVLPDSEKDIALSYLAWAAPYVIHPSREATLFQVDGEGKLRTKISQEPFVKALEDFLLAVNRKSDKTCEIIWPDHRLSEEPSELTRVSLLRPTDLRFSPLENSWETIPDRELPVPLLASRGQLVAVTTQSKNAAVAFRFMSWLVSPANCRLLSTSGTKVANPRGSFAKSSDDWIGSDRTRGKLCAGSLADSLRANQALTVPRIPGIDTYLAKLGASIKKSNEKSITAQEALADAAKQWDQITEDLGNSNQVESYQRSLGQISFEAAP